MLVFVDNICNCLSKKKLFTLTLYQTLHSMNTLVVGLSPQLQSLHKAHGGHGLFTVTVQRLQGASRIHLPQQPPANSHVLPGSGRQTRRHSDGGGSHPVSGAEFQTREVQVCGSLPAEPHLFCVCTVSTVRSALPAWLVFTAGKFTLQM